MSAFIVKLWEDIFTPGPTPTILKAANASFAALQTVLFCLLLANIHCVILSILCGGLWWSVNWFAAELAIAQREQRAKEEKEKQEQLAKEASGNDDNDDTETEVETPAPNKAPPVVSDVAAAGLEPIESKGEVKQRGGTTGTQSSVSTEDEWEKVSEAENEKDK
jgi:hypothetical protein